MDNEVGKIYLIFWCPPDTTPEFETSYLEDYGKVFATEVRIRGLDYVGRGVSSSKEGSKNNASIHYLMHLIRDGLLDKERVAKRVPCLPLGIRSDGSFDPSPLPDFLEPITDESFLESTQDPHYSHQQSYRFGEVEDESVSFSPHGNWTLENAMEGLENYFGYKIKDRFSYHTNGSGDSRVISCDLAIYMDELGKELRAWGQGKTVATSSSHCALSFIRQLYEKKLIGPYRASYQDREEMSLNRSHELSYEDQFNVQERVPLQVLVPQQAIGDVIGTDGSTITRIETKTGARIIFPENSKGDDLEGRIFTLFGEQDKVQAAAYIINKIIQWSLVKAANSLKQVLPNDQSAAKNEPTTSQQNFAMANSTNQRSSALQLQDFMTDISAQSIESKQIVVPQKAVGLVIGKEGSVIKSIEKESGTLMRFVNNSKDAPPGDRICSITGTSQQIQIAYNKINMIVQHLQQASGLPPEYLLLLDSNITTMKITVSPSVVGYVIGKDGGTIKRIQKNSGAKVGLMKGTTSKIFEISGKQDEVEAAAKEIKKIIGFAEQKSGNLPVDHQSNAATISQGSATIESKEEMKVPTSAVVIEAPPLLLKKEEREEPAASNDEETDSLMDENSEDSHQKDGEITVKVFIPEEVFKFVIGKKNATIQHISAKSGARCIIVNKKIVDKVGFRTCRVIGEPSAVDTASKRINALINIGTFNARKAANQAAQPTPEPPKGSAKMEVLVPLEMVECVVGKNGATINRISKDTGAHIVLHENQPGTGFGVKKCIITGEPPEIITAARRINALINVGVVRQTTLPLIDPQQAHHPANIFGRPSGQMEIVQQGVDRRSIIDAFEKQLLSKKGFQSTFQQNQDIMPTNTVFTDSLLQEKIKMNVPTPQRNWYRMTISNLNCNRAVQYPAKQQQYEFVLEPSLAKAIDGTLASIKVNPVIIPKFVNLHFAFSLKPKQNISTGKTSVSSQPDIVMRWWSPPLKNWDPWLNKTIDELPLSEMSLEQIGSELMNAHFTQIQNDEFLRNSIRDRNASCIRAHQHEILHAVKTNPIAIIHGPSGTGKTTQIPQYILDSYLNLERGAECCILVAQPRQINAIAAAERVANERCEAIGNCIGYEVPFESCFPRPYGCILFCTLDILLKRLEAGIRGVSHIIVDEIHERNAKSDFIITILRDMVKAFPHLHVVLMSATMDIAPLRQYFSNCAIVEVPLKTHPVQDYYLEDVIQLLGFVPDAKEKNEETEYSDHLDDKEDIKSYDTANYGYEYSAITKLALANIDVKGVSFDLIVTLLKYIETLSVKGSVLVFVPDCNTITALRNHLVNHSAIDIASYLCLSLHSEISPEEMKLVFQPAPFGITKIILSTSIAETAVTPRDVVYVIDSCKTVIKRFTPYNNAINYTTVWATKYNLEQRSRQASFVQPGYCFHLCSRECYSKLKNDVIPEIQYTPLHEIILSIKLLRLGNNKQFLSKLLKSPTSKAILDAEEFLADLGAIDTTGNLTPLGKMLARLPVEPRLGKMIILSCFFSLGDIACLLAAHSTIHPQSAAPNLEKFISYRCSDHIAFVMAFLQWQTIRKRSEGKEREFCERHHLSKYLLELIYNGKNHLKELVQSMGFPETYLAEKNLQFSNQDPNVDMIIALLAMGLHPNVCFHNESKFATESSINLATSFNSPFFTFGRKICTEDATYKDMTMIPLTHLLLFGNDNVHLLEGKIKIDSWIDLKMDPVAVCKIVAIRSALEVVVNDIAGNPKLLDFLGTPSSQVLSIVKTLCSETPDEVRLHENQYVKRSISSNNEPPSKRRFLDEEAWNDSDVQRNENQYDDYYSNSNLGHSVNDTAYGNTGNNIGSNPVSSRYSNENRYYERRVPTGEMEEHGAGRGDDGYKQRHPMPRGNGRATFLVDGSKSEYFQRHGAAREDFRESRPGYNRGRRGRMGNPSRGAPARSGLGYWSRE